MVNFQTHIPFVWSPHCLRSSSRLLITSASSSFGSYSESESHQCQNQNHVMSQEWCHLLNCVGSQAHCYNYSDSQPQHSLIFIAICRHGCSISQFSLTIYLTGCVQRSMRSQTVPCLGGWTTHSTFKRGPNTTWQKDKTDLETPN